MENQELVQKLKTRFMAHQYRHPHVFWEDIEDKLNDAILSALAYMEETQGEPDVLKFQENLYFVDFSLESPKRRSLCFDKKARETRKQHPPLSSVEEETNRYGISLLTEEEYIFLQELEDVDRKTSSWIDTPDVICQQGGALFGCKRYGRTFIYCNGADSYYASRGYRAKIALFQEK